jgi:hypothetical protein
MHSAERCKTAAKISAVYKEMKKVLLQILFFTLSLCTVVRAQQIILNKQLPNSFSLTNATIYVDANDLAVVKRSAALFRQDMEAVTGNKLSLTNNIPSGKNIIIIGSVENSSLIKQLILQKKINVNAIKDKWEAYQVQTIKNPFKGVEHALVIAGSDRRGTAFGVFELSKQVGVSPWYWWADVPVKKASNLSVKENIVLSDAPKVKYRGIFINDEAPALSNWSKEKFGGFNHQFYEKVFELILRLKGNYLWPAMWGNAFYYDDSLNIRSADEYGIVMGTSHHEPLMRAHEEWKYFGKGKKWNYDSTEAGLKEFWKGGMQRAWNEKIVSIGMRGDGDEPMSGETATALLERIVKDQRQIIEEVTRKPASATPQLWALYKEVQDYYDKGMRVPDDVTLLLCDDNWGNIRKLPRLDEKPRKGGYGIYYHFDYVGGPRNYKWINTNPIPRVWEQMHLAYEYNAKQIWIVNVGDIKPMEFPISFFLDYAWNPEKIGADDLQKYTEQWAAAQFGHRYAKEIADIISKYSKYNGRRKPELLDENTYSLDNYNEFETVVNDYNSLLAKAEKINSVLSPEYRDAYFQLVLHPVKACANLNEIYYNKALNKAAYNDKNIAVNRYAENVKLFYTNDSLITVQYHKLKNGKWNHMMDQTHIGYTYWQQPPLNTMPVVKYISQDSIIQSQEGIPVRNRSSEYRMPYELKGNIFFQVNNIVSIAADHYTKAINSNNIKWKILPDLGRTGNAVTTFPVTAAAQIPGVKTPQLEYEIYTFDWNEIKISCYFSPTLNFHNTATGLQYAIAVDGGTPQLISINKEDNTGVWNKWVADNIIIKSTTHKITRPGKHIIKYWVVDSGVVLQKIIAEFGAGEKNYLGAPETRNK